MVNFDDGPDYPTPPPGDLAALRAITEIHLFLQDRRLSDAVVLELCAGLHATYKSELAEAVRQGGWVAPPARTREAAAHATLARLTRLFEDRRAGVVDVEDGVFRLQDEARAYRHRVAQIDAWRHR